MSNTYLTKQGDTWDLISFNVYGSEFYVNELFEANQQYSNIFMFSSNVSIVVPDIDVAIIADLPPWERVNIAENETSNSDDLLNMLEEYDPDAWSVLSYRYVDRYTARMTETSKWGALPPESFDANLLTALYFNDIIKKSSDLR